MITARIIDSINITTALKAIGQKKSDIQTLILSKSRFKTKGQASKWVRSHGFKTSKVDEKKNTFRYRQKEPSAFIEGSFRTITLTDGVKAVIGRPKKKK